MRTIIVTLYYTSLNLHLIKEPLKTLVPPKLLEKKCLLVILLKEFRINKHYFNTNDRI